MKLAIVAHNLIRGDGQGRINLEIARHAVDSGHQVTLISETAERELLDKGVTWHRIRPLFKRPTLLNEIGFVRLADKLLDQTAKQFDVIIGNGYTLRHAHQVNLCQFVHGAWMRSPVHVAKLIRGPRSWYQRLYSWKNARSEKGAYAAAKFVVAPSQRIRSELQSIGVPDSKIRVIYNGVDLNEFRPGSENRASLGLPLASPLALFVGDIRSTRKNLDSVLKALVNVPQLHLAVGGNLKGSPFPAMAKELGVSDRVTFLDFRRDIGKLMRAVDFFIFPSRYEAGTLVLIEALASGLPAVTARTAGGCEIMSSDAGRIIEDPDDLPALTAAIAELASDESARKSASIAARRIAERYSWTNMAQAYLDLVEESRR
ncbi:glycosyltransferase family 4 protein [soil metagenome]